MAIVSLARYATDAAASFPSMVIRRLLAMSIRRCVDLLMAELALAADRGAVGRHVRVVVTAHAACGHEVALEVGIRPEADHHRGEDVAPVHVLDGRDAARERPLIDRVALRRIELAQAAFDRTHGVAL